MVASEKAAAAKAAAPSISWRERRRSRMAELVDGGAMIFSDVAMIRTAVIAVLMWAVAFVARRSSSAALPLAIAAGLFFVAETINTLVEMLVDRISLEANVFSARIKHASAFLSACVGTVAFLLLALVGYHLFFRPAAERGAAPAAQPPAPPGLEWKVSQNGGEGVPGAAPAAQPPAPPALEPGAAPAAQPPAPPAAIYLRWVRDTTTTPSAERSEAKVPTSQRPFASRHVMHPFDWERRVARKRRLRRRREAVGVTELKRASP